MEEDLSTMPRIEHIKTRLGGLFLKDRGNLDEQTADLIRCEVRGVLERYFALDMYDVRFSLRENGRVGMVIEATGERGTIR